MKPWEKQEEILASLRDNPRTAVASCTTVGKSEAAAAAILWFLYCFPPATVITTAPTFRQVREILWKKIRSLHSRAKVPLGGKLLETELKLDDNWFATGLSTKEPERMQGYHPIGVERVEDINMLVVVDEAAGVPQPIFDAAENIMTSGGNVRMLLLANPSALDGELHAAFHSKREIYNRIRISAYDSPNVQAGRIVIPGLITKEWVEQKLKIWGKDSPLFRVKALGLFPLQGENTLIPVDWYEAAVERNKTMKQEGPAVVSCDVARSGGDETVIGARKGRWHAPLEIHRGIDTMQTTGYVIGKSKEYAFDGQNAKIRVDEIGVGGGVVDRCLEQGMPCEGVNVGESAGESEGYVNLRAELYWELRKALDPNNENAIGLPEDDVLAGQLTSVRFKMTSTNKIQIESKDDMKKRGLTSPDRADAIMLLQASSSHGNAFLDWMKTQDVKK